MFFCSKRTGVELHFIQPGKRTQNAFVESFNGKFREYCLNLHWFASLKDAQSIIDGWREHYNDVRPHRSLGRIPPVVFAQKGQSHMMIFPHQRWLGCRCTVNPAFHFRPLAKNVAASRKKSRSFLTRFSSRLSAAISSSRDLALPRNALGPFCISSRCLRLSIFALLPNTQPTCALVTPG